MHVLIMLIVMILYFLYMIVLSAAIQCKKRFSRTRIKLILT